MVLLILESLGSTELVFILIMALVFFGPRKLPQISRTLGKNLAEFRRASEEFKRTWDREVTLEDSTAISQPLSGDSSILNPNPLQAPSISSVTPDQVVARQSVSSDLNFSSETEPTSDLNGSESEPQHSPKNDWL